MKVLWFRGWIWLAILVQLFGYVFDAFWHGVVSQGPAPTTYPEMVRHLMTVHLPLYLGALAVMITTGAALLHDARHAAANVSTWLVAPQIAFGAAVLSASAEAGHAALHLDLDTMRAPIFALVAVVGFLIVVVTMLVTGRRRRLARDTGWERSRAA